MSVFAEGAVLLTCLLAAPAFVDAGSRGTAALLCAVAAFIAGHMLGQWEAQ